MKKTNKNAAAQAQAQVAAQVENPQAEVETTQAPETTQTTGKLTAEECEALAEKLRGEHLNHKCEAMPYNTGEGFVAGQIIGVIADKRACKVFYRVRLEDGRVTNKAYDAKTLHIFEEVAEVVKATRAGRSGQAVNPFTGKAYEHETEWPELEATLAACRENIGKSFDFDLPDAVGQLETCTCMVTGLIIDKRPSVRRVIYKYDVICGDAVKKSGCKVARQGDEFAAERTEAGQALYEASQKRANRVTKSVEDKMEDLRLKIARAKESIAKWEKELEALKPAQPEENPEDLS